MKYSSSFAGDPLLKKLFIGGNIGAGVLGMHDTTFKGYIIPVTTTSTLDAFGVSMDAGVYAVATPVENTFVISPQAIYRARVSGAAADGTLLSAATKHVLTNTLASATGVLVTDAANVISVEQAGGTIIGLTGANAGLYRPITSYIAATSVTVTLQFPNAIAVGDKFVDVPFSPGCHGGTFTTALLEMNGAIAVATAATMLAGVTVELELPINSTNPTVWFDFVLENCMYNPTA